MGEQDIPGDALVSRPAPTGGVRRDRDWVAREYGDQKWPAVERILQQVLEDESPPHSLARVLARVERSEWRAGLPAARMADPQLAAGIGVARGMIMNLLLAICEEESAAPIDLVVELGAGWGYNLIRCWLGGGPATATYVAGEITEAGRRVAGHLAALDPRMQFLTVHADYLSLDLGTLPAARRALVFTCHSVEQVPHLPEAAIRTIAGLAGEVQCVHLEPVGWQEELGPDPDRARAYAEAHDYNRDLLPVLRRLASDGVVHIEEVTVPHLPWLDAVTAGCVVRWRAERTG